VHRYNHNLETARSFFPEVVTTHSWEERIDTLELVRELGMEVCCGGIIGMGETLAQRAESPSSWPRSRPTRCRSTFSTPAPARRSRTCQSSTLRMRCARSRRSAWRYCRTVLRFAGGRELTLGDLGTRDGMLGGINAMIIGNYLTALGRPPEHDLDLLTELAMPIKALLETL
jgi:biotin synthase